MATYQFGPYIYPYVSQVQAPAPARVSSADTPGRAGLYAGRRYAASRSVKLAGTLVGTSFDDVLYQYSRMVSAHETPDPQKLYTGRDGWFLWAQTESVDDTTRGIGHIEYEVNLRCSDPFYYSDLVRSTSLNLNGLTSIYTHGNTYALPVFNLSIAAAPAGSSITLTCVASNDFIVIKPTGSGENLLIDCLGETIKTGMGADRMNLFNSGRFIRLVSSPVNADLGTLNQIQITCTGGAILSAASISFRDRSL